METKDIKADRFRLARSVARVMMLVVAALLAVALLVHVVKGAPAPAAKSRPPADRGLGLPARCVMTWGGTDFLAEFRPDGSYRAVAACWPQGRAYVGTWEYDRRTHVLSIREALETYGPDYPMTYHTHRFDFSLAALRGRADWGTRLVLRPR